MDPDIDLAVEGLANPDLLEAMAELESAAAADGIPVDLGRLESLPPTGSGGPASAELLHRHRALLGVIVGHLDAYEPDVEQVRCLLDHAPNPLERAERGS